MDFDFDIADYVPLSFAALFIILAPCLQLVWWWLGVPFNISLKTFLATLPLLCVGVWRLAVAIKERFSGDTRDYQSYVYGELARLEKRLGDVERFLSTFQQKILNDVEALKTELSNLTCQPRAVEETAPTKEELEKLKATLGLEGSLQHKGHTIYHVLYDSQAKKHVWNRLGKWRELKEKLQEEKSSN